MNTDWKVKERRRQKIDAIVVLVLKLIAVVWAVIGGATDTATAILFAIFLLMVAWDLERRDL